MKLGRKPVLTRRIGREDGAATPPAGPTTGSKPGLSRPAPRATKSCVCGASYIALVHALCW
jgi:hypothetical protein